MYKLYDPQTIEKLMSENGTGFSKSLGQNFLIDPDVCPEMARMCGADKNSGVIEIGAGIGVLTQQLCKVAGKTVSFEIDDTLIPILEKTVGNEPGLKIINADIMKYDLSSLIKDEFPGMDVCVCANLPYYITSPVIMMLLEQDLDIRSITVMVQKEAGTRLCALPGTRDAGAVSAAVRYYTSPKVLFDVPKESFMPSPKVDSCVIKLDILEQPPVFIADKKKFFSMIKAAFAQRRKTACNSISSGMGISKQQVKDALIKCGLPENVRAEALSMQELAGLSNNL
jgi:16S rRNA (adenine1518-N6/adenine1519-N6)-dimethyltransferase